ncbi:MAG: hypothetical protein M1817_003596 [Caeruleum heppii]|nr:MAG: hypothetical protein M1817_003596 [Caeruleum heppii]
MASSIIVRGAIPLDAGAPLPFNDHDHHHGGKDDSQHQQDVSRGPLLLASFPTDVDLGFGTGTAWFKDGGKGPMDPKLVATLKTAISSGFTHIDCADSYGTEEEVGIAVKDCGLNRERLFVTTKVLDNMNDIPGAIDASLSKLQMDYVDLYLIHSPYYTKNPADLQRAWKAMETVKASGKARSIGVSNFQRSHIEALLEVATVVPAVNQLEFHPYLQRSHGYIPWMKEHGVQVCAFKGLSPLTVAKGGPLDGPLASMAERHQVSASAILLRWHMDADVVPITTTRKAERMAEYLEAVTLKLSPEEREEITRIGMTHHYRNWGNEHFDPDDRS